MSKRNILTIVMLLVMVTAVFAWSCSGGQSNDEDSYRDEAESQEAGTNIGSFTSVDMEGNEVSDAIFAENDVTVVNIWATFCGPCIEEMPELAAWADEMPGNIGIVGIVFDAPEDDQDNIELAKKICSETGVKYTNILASRSVAKTFENIVAVPTTFIVDKSGDLICPPFVGADVDGYKKAVEDYLAGL